QSSEDLADLFRASLLEPVELVKLSDEWRICETYLRIEQLRLDNRLEIEWDINTLPNDALIPPLSLQPLLENAIYHGIERLPEGGAVRIAGAFHNDQLIINIINPLPPENIEDQHHGNKQAQDNIRQRLLALFDKRGDLSVSTNENMYRVTITLPYLTQ
ncbi:MAG: histidine kinase, partial [Proteobacteria bacterium]|nr:histidine kinase [Pseudomonadota bacterium]